MKSYIFLDRICFFAHHGVGEQETLAGNEFTVSLRLQVNIAHAMQTDDVADTVSYADVYEAVKAEMKIPSKLLEHVGGRIVKRLFGDFPQIENIELKLSKRNPPMGADIPIQALRTSPPHYMHRMNYCFFFLFLADSTASATTCLFSNLLA